MGSGQVDGSDRLLRVEKLTKEFGGLRAVQDCSFDVPTGAIVGLIGPNGSGKTTTFNMISGFFPPTDGHVYFGGEDITGLPAYQTTRRGIARTFQLVRIFPSMTLVENLMVGVQHQRGEAVSSALLRPATTRRETDALLDRAMHLLKMFGLNQSADRFAGDVSYAEQKMTEIARALMTEPKLILLDEPTSGILSSVADRILDYVHYLRDEHAKTFMIVEHNIRMTMSHCDRIVVLNAGRKIAEGTPDEVSHNPEVIRAYLGE